MFLFNRIRYFTNFKSDAAKRAEEVFRWEYNPASKPKDVKIMFNYENHYSALLNKCFFLEIAVSHEKERLTATKDMRLFDLNDNKEIGIYMDGICDGCGPIACKVQDKVWRSESEWRQLLKPFMED
jgi:hypothetical protein